MGQALAFMSFEKEEGKNNGNRVACERCMAALKLQQCSNTCGPLVIYL